MGVVPLFLLSESLQLSMDIDETGCNGFVLGKDERNRSSKGGGIVSTAGLGLQPTILGIFDVLCLFRAMRFVVEKFPGPRWMRG
jgi:hypothetical protein